MRKIFLSAFLIFGLLSFNTYCTALPNLSYEEVTSLTDTTAIITWVTSNEASDTKVHYGISDTSSLYSSSESVNYHYAVLQNLTPGTIYKYYIKSGQSSGLQKAFTTLTAPTGQYLFSFATFSDPQYGMGKADTGGARGRPYSKSKEILEATVSRINLAAPLFTILKGDIIESSGGTYGDYINSPIPGSSKSIKDNFDDFTTNYYPIPGNHDKTTAGYTGGNASSWYNNNLHLLYPALSVADPTADSCFNYSFDNQGYRFIMLDSVKSNLTAEVNTSFLSQEVTSAETIGLKSFIFLHHPATDLRSQNIPDEIIEEITDGSTDYSKIQIINTAEVQAIITAHKDSIAGVFSGHIHDNHYEEISGVPYVRTSSGLQFPTGFNIYKVYTNGYMQTFYKIPDWTEVARGVITPEAGYNDLYWEQFSLGACSARNFTHTLSAAKPGVSLTTPASGETGIPLNEMATIKFTKAMDQQATQNAIVIAPSVSGTTFSWLSADTIAISHSTNFTESTLYSINVSGAKDLSGTSMDPYLFTFTTSANADNVPPNAVFNKMTYNITNDNQPVLTGIVTDELSSIASIECAIDGSAYTSATPIDGAYNSKQESFYFLSPSVLARSINAHTIEARCTDSAGNITYESYSFYVIGDRPEIGLKSNGQNIISGDPIGSSPSFEVTVISNKGMSGPLYAIIDSGTPVELVKTVNPTNAGIITSTYSPALSDGNHSIRIVMTDDSQNTTTQEVVGLVVQTTAEARVQGTPLSYPNPYLGTGNIAISYILSKNCNVNLTIHDLMGNQLVKKSFSSGQDGGKSGYNEITWNAKTDAGEELGNGIYIYLLTADGMLSSSRGKLTVARP